MSKPKSIKLMVRQPVPGKRFTGTVRIDPEAEYIVQRYQRDTGLSAIHIVSQIIIQADEQGLIELDFLQDRERR